MLCRQPKVEVSISVQQCSGNLLRQTRLTLSPLSFITRLALFLPPKKFKNKNKKYKNVDFDNKMILFQKWHLFGKLLLGCQASGSRLWRSSIRRRPDDDTDWKALACSRKEVTRWVPIHWSWGTYSCPTDSLLNDIYSQIKGYFNGRCFRHVVLAM